MSASEQEYLSCNIIAGLSAHSCSHVLLAGELREHRHTVIEDREATDLEKCSLIRVNSCSTPKVPQIIAE